MDNLFKYLDLLGHGIDETTILLTLVLFDTILAISWRTVKNKRLISSTAINGLLRNIAVSMIPVLLDGLRSAFNHNVLIYQIINGFFTIIIALTVLQSIIANLKLNGFKIPKFLKLLYDETIINEEIENKEEKK